MAALSKPMAPQTMTLKDKCCLSNSFGFNGKSGLAYRKDLTAFSESASKTRVLK
jgi:hypothetical protein